MYIRSLGNHDTVQIRPLTIIFLAVSSHIFVFILNFRVIRFVTMGYHPNLPIHLLPINFTTHPPIDLFTVIQINPCLLPLTSRLLASIDQSQQPIVNAVSPVPPVIPHGY